MSERLDKNVVCACFDETGSRQVEVVEQCQRCGATMDSDAAREARVEIIGGLHDWIDDRISEIPERAMDDSDMGEITAYRRIEERLKELNKES